MTASPYNRRRPEMFPTGGTRRACDTAGMHVQLKLRLDCRADAAWRALQSPAVMREVAGPWLCYTSLQRGGVPAQWEPGDRPVGVLAAGALPVGTQRIHISLDTERHPGVRMVRDDGAA